MTKAKNTPNKSLIIAILVAIVAIGAGSAYLLLNRNQNNSEITDNPTESSQMASADCSKISDEDFCHFVANTSNFSSQPYVAEIVSTKDGKESKMTLSSDGKGNTKIESDQLNMITLNGSTYTKMDQAWYKMSLPDSSSISGSDVVNDLDLKDQENLDERYKRIGQEACGSMTCIKYEVSSKSDDGTPATTNVWIDTKEHKLRKVEGSYDGGTMTMNISYQDVNISEPSPVQEMPGMDNVPGNL